MIGETIVAGRGLYKHFRLGDQVVRALDGIDISIPQGQFVVIMGASGSGKSTLLYALTGLDVPSAGQVYVAGRRLDQMDQQQLAHLRGRMIGFVFQSFYLVPTMTALENVMLPGLFAQHPRHVRYRRAVSLLRAMHLADRMGHRPHQLSGGQQQRVAIARALYNDPPIIVADEPTGALDSKTGTGIMRMLRQLSTRQGKTVLIVTHDPAISQYADRIIRLQDGHVIEDALNSEVVQ
ncbi:MAG TPA: ABC transporter ATP-binding protein [Spirillospora sp.]|nr:ABC transporter ATP-binding protein [Spirillospora sp.]